MSATDEDYVTCLECGMKLLVENATRITRRLTPRVVDYYHHDCYSPWAKEVREGKGYTWADEPVWYEKADPVNHPPHYRWLPNGIEVIDITENFGFLLGNVLKYVMRADHKGKPVEDLEKAAWYLAREIAKRKSSDIDNTGIRALD